MPVLCSAGAASVISASLALNSAACCTWASRSCLAVADSPRIAAQWNAVLPLSSLHNPFCGCYFVEVMDASSTALAASCH